MKAFNESLRYEYDLTKDSFCIDGGCYEGNWSKIMAEKYGCKIYAFEPMTGAAIGCKNVLAGYPNVHVFNAAIGATERLVTMKSNGDSTGLFNTNGDISSAAVWGITSIMNFSRVDVLKLNIEGMEYEVIEHLITVEAIRYIKNLQVQWHFNFKESKASYKRITEALERTHEQEWDSSPVWENWKLRE